MSKTYVQLGRLGDILNLLPLLYADSQKGERPRLMVAREYASLLEGVSYVEPIIYEGPHYELEKAVAQLEGQEYISTQVNGPLEEIKKVTYKGEEQKAITTSYQKEMWRVASRLKEWDNCYPLVFDRRDAGRENDLLIRCGLKRGRQKRLILVSIEGNTSKFEQGGLLLELLRGRFSGSFNVLGIPLAERFYDLLVLYEKAYCVVTTDSAPLHLARACPQLPVIAFTNDKPSLWNGSAWCPNHAFYCRYGDFINRWSEMLCVIDSLGDRKEYQSVAHVWNDYDKSLTGTSEFWVRVPIQRGQCGRDTQNILQDGRRVPFLKDCIRMGIQKFKDWIVLTRPNTRIDKPDLVADAAYAYRIVDGGYTPIVDMFYAKREWWLSHLSEIPDYALGNDYYWSHGLWALFKKYGARDVTGSVTRIGESSKGDGHGPRIQHNKKLSDDYLEQNKVHARYPKVSDQVDVVASFSRMTRYGYNPSIMEQGGKILMAYRYHDQDDTTKLDMATLNQDCTVFDIRAMEIKGASIEDPKLFRLNGHNYISWVDSLYPKELKSVVRISRLELAEKDGGTTPPLPKNDLSCVQKNYVFTEVNGQLACLYHSQPRQQVFVLQSSGEWLLHESNAPTWPYGEIRGGCIIPWNRQLLRFFHSGLDNEFDQQRRRYFIGACVMKAEPPFEVLSVSSRPIIYGSELDDLKVKDRPFHWKSKIVFPGGVIARDDYWLLALGVNDSQCVIAKIREKELHLA